MVEYAHLGVMRFAAFLETQPTKPADSLSSLPYALQATSRLCQEHT